MQERTLFARIKTVGISVSIIKTKMRTTYCTVYYVMALCARRGVATSPDWAVRSAASPASRVGARPVGPPA